MKQDYYQLEAAWQLMAKITPNSTPAAAVLFDPELSIPHAILSTCNTFPERVLGKPERLERPAKYSFLNHAEQRLIAVCARHGISTSKKGVYMHWFPCDTCARALIDAGISRIVCDDVDKDDPAMVQWHFEEAFQMLNEAGIEIIYRV